VEAKADVRRRVRGPKLVFVAAVAALALVGLALRSFAVAESSGVATPIAEILAFVVGVWLPLFALIYACVRSRVAVVVLAFCVGLSVNLVFLTHATPAAAVTDNSNVFTFKNSSNYDPPRFDMEQNYTPTASTATKCPSASGGFNWTCRFVSDQFSPGQSFPTGSATADLHLDNADPAATFVAASSFGAGSASSIAISKPTGVASGDLLLATVAIRGGTGNGTITMPSGWALVDRTDSVTAITLAVYSLVAGPSEPGSYSWSWSSGNQKSAGAIQAFRGFDTVTPIDAHAGQSESTPSATTHIAPSVTATFGNEMRVLAFADSSNFFCNGIIDFAQDAGATSTGGGSGSSDATINTFHAIRFRPAGPTGTVTGVCGTNDIGATEQLLLRSAAGAARTCTLTTRLKLLTTIQPGATTTATLNNGPSLSINVPAGVVAGDVLVATIGKTGSEFVGIPSGWTRVQHVGDSSTMDFGVFYHVVAGGDPASHSFTWTGSTNRYATGGITAYRNVDNDNPVDVNGVYGSGGGNVSSFPAPSITTTAANEMIVTTYGVAANNPAWTPPAGMTERIDQVAGTGATFVSIEQDDEFQPGPPGVTGTKTATSAVAGGGGAIIFGLRPGVTLGSGTAQVVGPTGATLASTTFATSAVSFADGDQLELELLAPNDSANCATWLSYDSASRPSKLTMATVVPEGVAGLLLLAPALPLAARWWKRRR
jgi:hypothetical protein